MTSPRLRPPSEHSPCSAVQPLPRLLSITLLLTIAVGCHKEPTPGEGVVQLEKTFPNGASENEAVRIAIAAAKTNDYAVGVVALQEAKRVPGLTADQLISVEQAAQAMTAELTRRADAGDAQAKASLEAIARTRSQ